MLMQYRIGDFTLLSIGATLITLRQVDAFRAVMMTGTITGAAEILEVSQPAISRLVKDLERALGFELFSRQGRQINPTIEGRMFFEEVETAHLGLNQLNQSAINIRDHKEGSLRIVTIPSVVTMFIGPILKAFNKEYPLVAVSLEVQPTQRVFEYLVTTLGFDKAENRPAKVGDQILEFVLQSGHHWRSCAALGTTKACSRKSESLKGARSESCGSAVSKMKA